MRVLMSEDLSSLTDKELRDIIHNKHPNLSFRETWKVPYIINLLTRMYVVSGFDLEQDDLDYMKSLE